jgi:hypothetical protein
MDEKEFKKEIRLNLPRGSKKELLEYLNTLLHKLDQVNINLAQESNRYQRRRFEIYGSSSRIFFKLRGGIRIDGESTSNGTEFVIHARTRNTTIYAIGNAAREELEKFIRSKDKNGTPLFKHANIVEIDLRSAKDIDAKIKFLDGEIEHAEDFRSKLLFPGFKGRKLKEGELSALADMETDYYNLVGLRNDVLRLIGEGEIYMDDSEEIFYNPGGMRIHFTGIGEKSVVLEAEHVPEHLLKRFSKHPMKSFKSFIRRKLNDEHAYEVEHDRRKARPYADSLQRFLELDGKPKTYRKMIDGETLPARKGYEHHEFIKIKSPLHPVDSNQSA